MKILNPDADLKIDRFLIDNMKKNLESYRQPNASLDNWRNWSSLAAALKILGLVPDLNIDDECWQGMKSALEDAEKTNSGNGPGLARNMKILRPDQSILSPEIWRRIDGALEAYKKDLDKNSFGGTGYESFLHLAANIKILDPSHDLGIDDGVWEKLKGRLEWVRGEGSYVDILDDLMNMKILAAEDVRIPSEGGLVVNMRKPKSEFASDVPPLPETKQF
jgi:hypothetical protein